MFSRCKLAGWPLVSVAALVLSLTFSAASQADKKPKPAPKKGRVNPTTLRFEEAQALRKAFIGLEGGNHNYNGHRVKAMAAPKAALTILDDHMMAHGSKAQQATIRKEQAVAAQAEAAGNRAAVVHVPQRVSNGQLRQAGEWLVQIRAILVANKQKPILTHVDAAIQEIGIALKTP
jgi:hypothetical protein